MMLKFVFKVFCWCWHRWSISVAMPEFCFSVSIIAIKMVVTWWLDWSNSIISKCEVSKCSWYFKLRYSKNYMEKIIAHNWFFLKWNPVKNRHWTTYRRLIYDNFYPVITAFEENMTLINIYRNKPLKFIQIKTVIQLKKRFFVEKLIIIKSFEVQRYLCFS